MNTPTQDFGARVRAFREQAGISQEKLAQRMSCSKQTIANVEQGKQEPRLETIMAYSEALGVPIADLIKVRVRSRSVRGGAMAARLTVNHQPASSPWNKVLGHAEWVRRTTELLRAARPQTSSPSA